MSAARKTSVRLPSDEQRERLMVQAAKLYYELESSQSQIASTLGLTRWQVGRLLSEARESGIVRIEIAPRGLRCTDMEIRLQKRFDLLDAIVVPADSGEGSGVTAERVAQAAADYIAGMQPKPDLLGLSWGRSMSSVARLLPRRWSPGLHVVLVNGATNLHSSAVRNSAVAEAFAHSAGGSATLLPVPAILGHPATRDALESDPIIANVLELARRARVVCFGMGDVSHDSVLLRSGYLTAADIDELRALGAVGDLLGRFVDAHGRIVDERLDARTVGMRLDELSRKDCALGVAAGEEKSGIALAALRAGYVSVLITDDIVAAHALAAPSATDGEGAR